MSLFELTDVRMEYLTGHSSVNALRKVTVSFTEGINVIYGKSGSGKSTLLHVMAGFEKPTGGSIKYEGSSIYGELDLKDLHRKEFGFVFQSFNLINQFSVEENILLPARFAKNKDRKRYEELIERLGISQFVKRLPSTLSGGEQQRVAIARALVNGPKVIFADEPTGNLDSENSKTVTDMLLSLCRDYGASLFMVTHDLDMLNLADRTYNMIDGTIHEE
jgi:ABC-type lipoprotein export system ATPase subunit